MLDWGRDIFLSFHRRTAVPLPPRGRLFEGSIHAIAPKKSCYLYGDNMYDELTKVDIEKMKAELEHRIGVIRPKILEEVKLTRSYGDLSENAEYHAAKRERGKNESRIRFLRNMIKTAIIIDADSAKDEVGLCDTVTYFVEEDDCEETVRIVTTLRRDPFLQIISKESPLGSALMGKKVGDRVKVKVNDEYSYFIVVKKIEKGEDDQTLEIRKF